MNQRIIMIISWALMIILSLLLTRIIYLNLMTFKKITPNYSQTSYTQNIGLPRDKIISDAQRTPESFCQEGSRPDWLSEWWYFAGHLEDEENPAHKFGLTLIFHKNPPHIKFNLSDSEQKENFSGTINFQNYDIIKAERLNLKKYDFFWISTGDAKYQIGFRYNDRQVNLDLVALKDFFIITNNGEAFYCQQSRLEAKGSLVVGNRNYKIKGQGWIDHQGFKGAIPWKSWRWHSLQLNNNIEIVFVTNFMDKSGNFSEKNALFIFDNQGREETIVPASYQIKDIEYFQDPQTSIKYPIKWQLEIPGRDVKLISSSITADQVIDGSDGFYQGSCEVSGVFQGEKVSGRAQFEYMP